MRIASGSDTRERSRRNDAAGLKGRLREIGDHLQDVPDTVAGVAVLTQFAVHPFGELKVHRIGDLPPASLLSKKIALMGKEALGHSKE